MSVLFLFWRKPTAMLRGHNAPIFYLFIAEEESRIFSISTDKCVKVSKDVCHKIHNNLKIGHCLPKKRVGYIGNIDNMFCFDHVFFTCMLYNDVLMKIYQKLMLLCLNFCLSFDFRYGIWLTTNRDHCQGQVSTKHWHWLL